MNYQHANWLFDTVMPQVDPNAFKVISVVARKTWGWGKNSDMISISQFKELTGIKSKPTVLRAIESALESGFISRQEVGQSYVYRMDFYEKGVQKLNQLASTENEPVSNKTGIEIKPTGIEIKPELVQKLNPQREKEYIKIDRLADKFEEMTGYFMPHDREDPTVKENWVKPLLAIDSQGRGEDRIEYAVNAMREKKYKIFSPKSIMKFALNWNGSNNAVKQTSDGGMYV